MTAHRVTRRRAFAPRQRETRDWWFTRDNPRVAALFEPAYLEAQAARHVGWLHRLGRPTAGHGIACLTRLPDWPYPDAPATNQFMTCPCCGREEQRGDFCTQCRARTGPPDWHGATGTKASNLAKARAVQAARRAIVIDEIRPTPSDRPSGGVRGRGQALVEFAMVIPIILMLVLAGADIARWTAAQSGAQRAAGTIADAAARTTADLSDLVAVELEHAGCGDGEAIIDGDTPSGVDTTYVVVRCPFAGFSPFFGGTVEARADAVVVAP
jgi:hypothetical protein